MKLRVSLLLCVMFGACCLYVIALRNMAREAYSRFRALAAERKWEDCLKLCSKNLQSVLRRKTPEGRFPENWIETAFYDDLISARKVNGVMLCGLWSAKLTIRKEGALEWKIDMVKEDGEWRIASLPKTTRDFHFRIDASEGVRVIEE